MSDVTDGALVLCTNDDGIDGPGLAAMASALHAAGHRVVVVAPATNMSGTSAAIAPVRSQIPVRTAELAGVPVPTYVVDAPPALIVVCAMQGAFGPRPDAVVAGVNDGVNLGRAVLHSGTVGAALTATNLGVPALAVSMQSGGSPEVAAALACPLVAELLDGAVTSSTMNLNVPAAATLTTRVIEAELARFGAVTAALADGALNFELVVEPDQLGEAGTDAAALRDGFAALTHLAGFSRTAPTAHTEVVTRLTSDPAEAPAAGSVAGVQNRESSGGSR